MKKKKEMPAPVREPPNPTSPLSSLANDFKSLDKEDALCQRKNDGTD
ncbi:MAG: hypothetical protein WCS90_05095 [Bacilli bacterium]